MHFGAFEGKTHEQLTGDPRYLAWLCTDCTGPCPDGGEAMAAFSARVCAAFTALVRESIARGEPRLYCLLHGGTIMALCDRFAAPRRAHYTEWLPKNLCGFRVSVDEKTWAATPTFQAVEPLSPPYSAYS